MSSPPILLPAPAISPLPLSLCATLPIRQPPNTPRTLTSRYVAHTHTRRGPIRRVPPEKLLTVAAHSLKAVTEEDFMSAIKIIRPSSGQESLKHYAKWTSEFGTG